jgi:hypothetical protein
MAHDDRSKGTRHWSVTRRQFLRDVAAGAGALGVVGLEGIGSGQTLPEPAVSGIEHVVVVMMENRSLITTGGAASSNTSRRRRRRFRRPTRPQATPTA